MRYGLLAGGGPGSPRDVEWRSGITQGSHGVGRDGLERPVGLHSGVQALESEAWAKEHLGRSRAVGQVDRDKLNVCGGSIALGHPFGATGARITTTLARELARREGQYGLLSVCAQGGMGFAMVLER